MTSRHFKTAAAAVGVLLAFAFVYDRVFHVQPVVENPPNAYRLNQGDGQTEADGENRSETDTQDGAEEGDSLERVAPELVSLFPPGDWRRMNANILIPAGRECFFFSQGSPRFEADSKILVLGKGTLVFLGEKKPGETDEERADRAIVFESEDDMTLEFAEPLINFMQGDGQRRKFDFSHFSSGMMRGVVSLRAKIGSSDFLITTRDVGFNAKQLHTRAKVEIYLGPNKIEGKDLTIDFETPLRFVSRSAQKNESQDGASQEPPKPIDPIDALAKEGNLGAGFSVKSVRLESTRSLEFYSDSLSEFSDKDKKENGKADDKPSYHIVAHGIESARDDGKNEGGEVSQTGAGVYFSSDPNVLGGWCLRFQNKVYVTAFQDGVRMGQVSGDSIYFYLQDKEIARLAETAPSAADAIKRKSVTGVLSRLVPTRARVLGRENRISIESRTGSYLQADEIQYDMERGFVDLVSQLVKPQEPQQGQEAAPDAGNQDQVQTPARTSRNGRQKTREEIERERIETDDLRKDEGEFKYHVKVDFEDEEKHVLFYSPFVRLWINKNAEFHSAEFLPAKTATKGAVFAYTVDRNGKRQKYKTVWNNALRIYPVFNTVTKETYLNLRAEYPITATSESLGQFDSKQASFLFRFGEPDLTAQTQNVAEVWKAENLVRQDDIYFPLNSLGNLRPVLANFIDDATFKRNQWQATISDALMVRFLYGKAEEGAEKTEEEQDGESVTEDLVAGMGNPNESIINLEGDVLDIACMLRSSQDGSYEPDILGLDMQGNVSFREKYAATQEVKMNLQADRAQVLNPGKGTTSVYLRGSRGAKAKFNTEKLSLSGDQIKVDSVRNAFIVAGEGDIEIAPLKEEDGRTHGSGELTTLTVDEPIKINWSKELRFDGQTLSFSANENDYVVVTQGAKQLRSPQILLTLKNPVSIFDVNDKDKLDVDAIVCEGSVFQPIIVDAIEEVNRSDGRKAQFAAILRRLKYEVATGEFIASDGGEIHVLAPENGNAFSSFGSSLAGQPNEPKQNAESGAPSWMKAHMKFQGTVAGKTQTREATLENGVRLAVASVADPNAEVDVDNPSACPQDCAYIESQKAYLKAIEAPPAAPGGHSGQNIEIEAKQNVVFKQKDVEGICDALRYVSEKKFVVLTGDNTRKAALYRQPYPGAQREQLGEFDRATYQLDTQELSVEALSHD